MPIGTCDPASRGDAFNSAELQFGPVNVKYRFGWDGVSTRETGCVGPLVQGTGAGNRWAVAVANTSQTETWYVHFKGRRGQPKVFELPPGFSDTFTVTQLANRGFDDSTDLEDLRITNSATPPQSLIG